jgi:hypothetical protein
MTALEMPSTPPWPYFGVSNKDFLRALMTEKTIEVRSPIERRWLERRTVCAAIASIIGHYWCEACAARGIVTSNRLEGHHIGKRNMYLSCYRHCKKLMFRRRALVQLIIEIEQHCIILCKTCHEHIHHSPAS